MSSVLVACIVVLSLLATVLTPYAALLAYEWTSYLPPNTVSFGPFAQAQFPRITALAAMLAFVFLQRDKFSKIGPGLFLIGAYGVWITITSNFFAVAGPSLVMWKYNIAIKTVVMAGVLYLMTDSRARLEAFLSIYVLAISYWIVMGAVKTLLTGGGYGLVSSGGDYLFADGSTLSVGAIMAGIVIAWVGKHSVLAPFYNDRIYRTAALIFIGICAVLVIGTQARTGLIAGVAAYGYYVLKSRHRVPAVIVAAIAGAAIFTFAPPDWLERMSSITASGDARDQSAAGRFQAWGWAWEYAKNHPFTGGGFRVFYALNIVELENGKTRIIDSHSYFFEILAEQGFTGLFIFLSLAGVSWFGLLRLERQLRDDDDYVWAKDLARTMQYALVALLTGGLFIGIGHFALTWDFLAIAAALPRIIALERERAGHAPLSAKAPAKRLPRRLSPSAAPV